MPSDSALVSFEVPGPSPTTRAKVLADTEPGDFPPRPVMAASASSRLKPVERPGHDNCLAEQVLGQPRRLGSGETDPSGAQTLDHRPVVLRGEVPGQAGGDHGSDALDRGELALRWRP